MRPVPARLLLALVAAVLAFLPTAARTLDTQHAYTFVVLMKASAPGWVQVFGDVGQGFTPHLAPAVPLLAGDRIEEYRLPLPVGRYVGFRLDPGLGPGRYQIERAAILDTDGTPVLEIPLASFVAAHQLSRVGGAGVPLVVKAPEGANDPQLLFTPAEPLWLLPPTGRVPALVRRLLLDVAIALGVVWLVQLLLGGVAPAVSRRLERWAAAAAVHPWITLPIAAFAATLVSCYPTLFFDRSLVSPNNGQVPMLYSSPPLVPSSGDFLIEDVRDSDVGAAMWAFLPYSHVQRQALAHGEVPLWNRYNSAGVPLWGQGQTGILDPLRWITFIDADPVAGWDLTFAAHRFVASWGVGVAAFTVLGAVAPAALAAATSSFLGVYAFGFNHPATLVLTYAPWVLAGWFLLARAADRRIYARAALRLALATALLLVASPPKEAAVMLLVLSIVGLLAVLLAPARGGARWHRLLIVCVATVAAILLTAPHWWIFLDTLKASATYYDVPHVQFAGRLATLALVLGSLAPSPLSPGLQTVTCALVVAALLSPRRLLAHRSMLACVLGAAGALALAYGAIPGDMLIRLPFVGNIHRLDQALLTASITPLLIVSALGAQAILQATRTSLSVFTIGVAACAAWVFGEVGGWAATGRTDAWLALFALGGAIALPASLRSAARSFPRLLPLVAVVTLIGLLLSPGGQQLRTGITTLDKVLIQPRLRVPVTGSAPVIDAIDAAATAPTRVLGLGTNLLPGANGLYDLEGIAGPDALLLPHLRELLDASGPPLTVGWMRFFTRADADRAAAALDLLNVGYIVAAPDELAAGDQPMPMRGPDPLRAIPRPTAWPRAFFIDRVGRYATPADLLAQTRDAGQAMASIFAGDANAAAITQGISSGPADPIPATQYRLTPNTTTFHVQAPHAGVVVLAEAYVPDDFVATLNGMPVPYFRVNHVFKGVAVPGAGDWDVRFEYRPRHWNLALTAAAAGVLVLAALWGMAITRARQVPPTSPLRG